MAFLKGLPSGVMKNGVLILGVFLTVPPGLRSGDRERDGEWNCDGGSDRITCGVCAIGGVGATDAGRGVIGAELAAPSTSKVVVASPIFLHKL